jgi:hypothetical protein
MDLQALPPVLLITLTVALGAYLGLQYLRDIPRKGWITALHLIAGAFAMESLAVLLHGTPDGQIVDAGDTGHWAVGLLIAALFTGFVAAVIGRRGVKGTGWVLAAHAGAGAMGFGLLLVWVV